jgi:hypothetical protein
VAARGRLEQVAGEQVDEAALPLGRYDRRLLGELRRLGYARVHTSDRRWATTGAWLQPRFSITGKDTIETVRTDVLTAPGRVTRFRLVARGVAKQLR